MFTRKSEEKKNNIEKNKSHKKMVTRRYHKRIENTGHVLENRNIFNRYKITIEYIVYIYVIHTHTHTHTHNLLQISKTNDPIGSKCWNKQIIMLLLSC